MKDREVLCTLRRVNAPVGMVFFAAWGLMMIGMAIWGVSDGFTTWRLQVWKMELPAAIFISLFMAVWFGFILFLVWYALRPFQRVKITEDEALICFGPIILRRLPVMHIRSVVRTGDDLPPIGVRSLVPIRKDRHGNEHRRTWRLVLCEMPKEELRQISVKPGHVDSSTASNTEMRRFVQRCFRYNRFWLEWYPEAETELRKYLVGADFIL